MLGGRLAAVARGLVVSGLCTALLAGPVAGGGTSSSDTTATEHAPAAGSGGAILVGQQPCSPDSIFTCITLRVPRDQLGPADPAVEITFALHEAKPGKRRGTFVTITGGPGTSGIASADFYTEFFDQRIVNRYDIVFIDQRGIGRTQPLQCPEAALAFYTSTHLPTISRAEADAFAADSETFADDCIAETGVDPADLPYFSTRNAVEDLDDIRAWLGAGKLDLYGESYGTQFAQTFAAAHPNRVRSLILDGPVDLTLTGLEYYREDAHAFDAVLRHTLDDCSDTTACRRDLVGADALADYDKLAARLRQGPLAYRFTRSDGSRETRSFGLGDLETAAAGYMYGEFDRMTFQRALVWASRGQLLPLARLVYISLGQDPETLAAIPDPTYSDAMFYAVECMDYAYGTGSEAARAERYLDAGEAAGMSRVRIGSVYYGDLPCAYWPTHPAPGRPDFLTDEPFPTFVLASTWDPATPYAGAKRIYRHLDDGYLIVHPGGPHVIFGRGNACPDRLITRFLLEGTRPASRRTTCGFTGVDPYVRVPAEFVSDVGSALTVMRRVDDELNNSADYWAWDGLDTLRYGCLFGGWLRYTPIVVGYRVTLDDCELTKGLPLSGTARINVETGSFRIQATGPGTDLLYVRTASGRREVSGEFLGKPAH
jgi:pimeloyl-ACP methyl ester carboxylesterase